MLPEDDLMIETCSSVLSNSLKHSMSVLNCYFRKEQSILPEDDCMIETCRSV